MFKNRMEYLETMIKASSGDKSAQRKILEFLDTKISSGEATQEVKDRMERIWVTPSANHGHRSTVIEELHRMETSGHRAAI